MRPLGKWPLHKMLIAFGSGFGFMAVALSAVLLLMRALGMAGRRTALLPRWSAGSSSPPGEAAFKRRLSLAAFAAAMLPTAACSG